MTMEEDKAAARKRKADAKEAARAASRQEVSVHTPVKRGRAHNIDTDRLLRRGAYITGMIEDCNNNFDSRHSFAMKAFELQAIENVLEDRGVITKRKTIRTQPTGDQHAQ